MVRSNHLAGVEVRIEQNGIPVAEYEDKEITEDGSTTTRYIEAKTGEEFAIHLEITSQAKLTGDCLIFAIFLDGAKVREPLLDPKRNVRTIEGLDVKKGIIRKFRFAKIETESGQSVLDGNAAKMKDVGSIVIKVTHAKIGVKVEREGVYGSIEGIGVVSEKALKGQALSHSIELGNTKNFDGRTFCTADTVPGVPNPAEVFKFHYRSIEALKATMIIPRTPSPTPLEERDIASMSEAELRDLQKELKAFKDAQVATVKIKREPSDDNPRPRKVARRHTDGSQLEIDDDGNFREGSTSTPAATEPEVIVID